MAAWALSWLQRKIGVDITGEAEFEAHKTESSVTQHDPCRRPSEEESCGIAARSAARPRLSSDTSRVSLDSEDPGSFPTVPIRRSSLSVETEPAIVTVRPMTLFFPPPYDKYIINTLVVENPGSEYIAYKLKATSPDSYTVKPRQGILSPLCQDTIQITFRPTESDPTKFPHRFMLVVRTLATAEVEYFQRTLDLGSLCNKEASSVALRIRCEFPSVLPANLVIVPFSDEPLSPSMVTAVDDPNTEAGEVTQCMSHASHRRRSFTALPVENY